MRKSKSDLLEQNRDLVIDNLEILQISLSELERIGFRDEDEVTYNQLGSLIEAADNVSNLDEMDEVLTHARVIEKQIDFWLNTHNLDSKSLSWPRRPH